MSAIRLSFVEHNLTSNLIHGLFESTWHAKSENLYRSTISLISNFKSHLVLNLDYREWIRNQVLGEKFIQVGNIQLNPMMHLHIKTFKSTSGAVIVALYMHLTHTHDSRKISSECDIILKRCFTSSSLIALAVSHVRRDSSLRHTL